MIQQDECFVKLNIKSNVSKSIIEKIKNSSADKWSLELGQDLFELSIDDFKDDPEISQIINDLGEPQSLYVFRLHPNVCYQWHTDMIREGTINMVLDGFDSFCTFGTLAPARRFTDLIKLVHEPDTYYLLNVKKYHAVFNFSQTRYIISISVPNITYQMAREYLKGKNLIHT